MGNMPLKVSNIVMSGKIPISHKLDYSRFISDLDGWIYFENICSPLIQKQYFREDGNISRRTRKKSKIVVSIWSSGAINIVGLKSIKEGEETFDRVMKELQSIGVSLEDHNNGGR